jgi:molybdate transport system permease protein
VAIYFDIQAGDTRHALVLVAIVLVISFVSLAAIGYWKGRTPGARGFLIN